jgi:hypothetical protein
MTMARITLQARPMVDASGTGREVCIGSGAAVPAERPLRWAAKVICGSKAAHQIILRKIPSGCDAFTEPETRH